MSEDWLSRWRQGRTGWHEPAGNAGLKRYWPGAAAGRRVLVPLCGKSPDLLWLARHGHAVTGVELSAVAVAEFFVENHLDYETTMVDGMLHHTATSAPVTIVQGDYFELDLPPFDALYDRAALVAMPSVLRPRYVEHTRAMLVAGAARLIVTLEYDQDLADGPPFSVTSAEMRGYWDDLERVAEFDGLDNSPPKVRQAGIDRILEVVWRSPGA